MLLGTLTKVGNRCEVLGKLSLDRESCQVVCSGCWLSGRELMHVSLLKTGLGLASRC